MQWIRLEADTRVIEISLRKCDISCSCPILQVVVVIVIALVGKEQFVHFINHELIFNIANFCVVEHELDVVKLKAD